MVTKFKWTPELMDELYEGRMAGKSLPDLVNLIYSKYGVQYSSARVSQIITLYTNSLKGTTP